MQNQGDLPITYGIDKQGKMYIFNVLANKMIFYGDPKQGAMAAKNLTLDDPGIQLRWEGDKTNGTWANVQPQVKSETASAIATNGGGGGYAPAPKVLDQAQLDSLQSLLGTYDAARDTSKKKAGLKRDASLKEKETELNEEQGKYTGKKLETLQDFAGAKTDTDINTRNTLENLISSLSTMGLGGSRALTRQILDNANMSNRKANATQATNNRNLDAAFNDYKAGNENDVKKIGDQYGYDVAEADRSYGQDRQNALYKMADVYNAADDTGNRNRLMQEGNDLNSFISGSAFVNPSYTGEKRAMATPELGDYTQNIAQYNTGGVGDGGVLTPVNAGAGAPGNLAVRAVAVNNKDFGVKKKTEGDLGYGV